MRTKVLKYIVAAILIEEDDAGNVQREIQTDPANCYGREEVLTHIEAIENFVKGGGVAGLNANGNGNANTNTNKVASMTSKRRSKADATD